MKCCNLSYKINYLGMLAVWRDDCAACVCVGFLMVGMLYGRVTAEYLEITSCGGGGSLLVVLDFRRNLILVKSALLTPPYTEFLHYPQNKYNKVSDNVISIPSHQCASTQLGGRYFPGLI